MATMGHATTDVKIVIGNDSMIVAGRIRSKYFILVVKCDAPPAYADAIKLPKEKEDENMLPKYTEK